MAIIALFTAAIAVEPFLFAAILIELAVLLSIPILAPPGKVPGRGILRYLTFQTLGMPFILIAGFLLIGLENSPGEPIYIAVAIASLAIGFALLLAVFPFYTWIPMLAEESHPYPTAFIFLLLPTGILLLGLNFLDTFTWLYENPNSEPLLQVVGAVMVVTAGIWAATEKNIARMMGFAVLLDIGFSLLAISLSLRSEDETYRILFFTGLVPRGLSLGVLALALSSLIGKVRSFELDDVRGLAKIYPVNSIAIVAAIFCFVGLPLLAGFPIKLGVIEGLSGQSLAIAIWVVLGAFGLLVGGIRASLAMVSEEAETLESLPISRVLIIFLVIGVALLFLIGLLPNLLLKVITGFPGAFTSLG
jgi:formate hydrogenlyase subunit 3/multisubunit Na+/H+ antiporter MnhD subunit